MLYRHKKSKITITMPDTFKSPDWEPVAEAAAKAEAAAVDEPEAETANEGVTENAGTEDVCDSSGSNSTGKTANRARKTNG